MTFEEKIKDLTEKHPEEDDPVLLLLIDMIIDSYLAQLSYEDQ